MSITSAQEYAQSISAQIQENVDTGYPFGYDTDREEYGEEPELSAYDYLEGVLDIEYIISSSREYLGSRIQIAYGGPNAWINTRTRQIECNWYSDIVRVNLPAEFCAELDQALEEIYLSC